MTLSEINAKLLGRKASILGQKNYRKSAVLLPLLEKNNEIHLLFEVRSMSLRSQPGDICFPGGKKEKEDKTPMECAIRETTEELGIPETSIENVYPLDYIVSDSGRMIYPFVGTITTPEKIAPNETEVGEVFTVPLSYLLNNPPETFKINFQVQPEKNFPFDKIVGGEKYNWQMRQFDELFYQYEGRVIWGLTAKILHHFLELIEE